MRFVSGILMSIPGPPELYSTGEKKDGKGSSHPGHRTNLAEETLFDHQPLG